MTDDSEAETVLYPTAWPNYKLNEIDNLLNNMHFLLHKHQNNQIVLKFSLKTRIIRKC